MELLQSRMEQTETKPMIYLIWVNNGWYWAKYISPNTIHPVQSCHSPIHYIRAVVSILKRRDKVFSDLAECPTRSRRKALVKIINGRNEKTVQICFSGSTADT